MIRAATLDDAAAIAAIWNPVIRDTTITFNPVEKSPADVSAMIVERQAAGHAFAVATEGDRILGFGTYAQFRGGAGYARTMEHTIQLAPDAAGLGFGRAMMAYLCDHAAKAGAHSMWAGVSAENETGVAFHAALGFDNVARLPEVGFKFGRWIDLILMQRRL